MLQTLLASCFISRNINPETTWIFYSHVATDLEPAWDCRCLGDGGSSSQTNPSGIQIWASRSRLPSTSGNQTKKVVVTQGCNTPAGEISPPALGVGLCHVFSNSTLCRWVLPLQFLSFVSCDFPAVFLFRTSMVQCPPSSSITLPG